MKISSTNQKQTFIPKIDDPQAGEHVRVDEMYDEQNSRFQGDWLFVCYASLLLQSLGSYWGAFTLCTFAVLQISGIVSRKEWRRHQLKHRRRLIYFLYKSRPEREFCSHSQESQTSSSATEFESPPAGCLGFGNTVLFLLHITAFILSGFYVNGTLFQTRIPAWKRFRH